ncbi:hypothetical protein DY245_26305 [Streptomyces inhibens]|uniref:Uncharacterized protein n=1 Tax=Streptomyces inhibens TaxID=2293571 RepID=A0A371PYL9_STRIH|nr:hypothetical protein [Streptomyces inhibens]REK87586.1 hypothetical protein DY245_26305 [Streptomyces inhibens]
MGFNPDDIVTVEPNCAGWFAPCTRDITRHQLGQLLLSFDDMASGTQDRVPDHAQIWPSPEAAYVSAPSIDDELDWLNLTANASYDEDLDRDWYLRNAAALDRIALGESTSERACPDEAEATAVLLLDLDQVSRDYDPRAYVRQQYALWRTAQGTGPEPSRS